MKFWKKFFAIIGTIFVFLVLELYSNEVCRIEFKVLERNFSIGFYVALLVVLSSWLALFSIKSFFTWLISIFCKDKTAGEMKSILGIAKLIMSSDRDFKNLFEKTEVVESMQLLKMVLALKRNLFKDKFIERTGIPSVDIHILKNTIRQSIEKNELKKAVDLATKISKSYREDVNVVKDEMLEVAKLARVNGLLFDFNPAKFKYGLPRNFVDEYFISLNLMDFELEQDQEKKRKIIEKIQKNNSTNIDVLKKFCDFFLKNTELECDEKKLLNAINGVISTNPHREVAYYMLKLNRKDIFEVAQHMMMAVKDCNLEKLWLLLIIATRMNFVSKSKELIRSIMKIDKSYDILKFYIGNIGALSVDKEIVSAICGVHE
ncbi:MAG: hypothetical protein LBB34_04540 [Holosporales bacterium]|jgi:hypothetical protein|nr:hypothetical protein [Holosporales bacterium]